MQVTSSDACRRGSCERLLLSHYTAPCALVSTDTHARHRPPALALHRALHNCRTAEFIALHVAQDPRGAAPGRHPLPTDHGCGLAPLPEATHIWEPSRSTGWPNHCTALCTAAHLRDGVLPGRHRPGRRTGWRPLTRCAALDKDSAIRCWPEPARRALASLFVAVIIANCRGLHSWASSAGAASHPDPSLPCRTCSLKDWLCSGFFFNHGGRRERARIWGKRRDFGGFIAAGRLKVQVGAQVAAGRAHVPGVRGGDPYPAQRDLQCAPLAKHNRPGQLPRHAPSTCLP